MEFAKLRNDEKIHHIAQQLTAKKLGGILDHTLLNSFATKKDLEKLCNEAKAIHAATVCINETYVQLAKEFLKNSGVKVCCVIGFPFGATTTAMKAYAAQESFKNGADEVDMVINQGFLLDNNLPKFKQDVEEVVKVTKKYNRVLKVIIETCYLNKEHIAIASKTIAELSRAYGCQLFVKTSTGFGNPSKGPFPENVVGATIENVELMRKFAGEYSEKNKVGIKAAGGVKDAETAIKMILAAGGVDSQGNLKNNLSDIVRIGTSSGVNILETFIKEKRGYKNND